MYGVLGIASSNFEIEEQRDYIMQIICNSCKEKDLDLQSTAFLCLVKIAELYYEYLNDSYMKIIWAVGFFYFSFVCDFVALINNGVERLPLKLLVLILLLLLILLNFGLPLLKKNEIFVN